jgi:hypothetical protein
LPDQFWELTPVELNIIIEFYIGNEKNNKKSGIVAAFYSAYFYRLKELSGSDLEKVLSEIDEPANQKEMTDEQMLAVVKRMSAVFGG